MSTATESATLPAGNLRSVVGLEWNEWTNDSVVPIAKWLLVEIADSHFAYQTAIFRHDSKNNPLGTVGGRFHFDCKIKRWADISHLMPNTPGQGRPEKDGAS